MVAHAEANSNSSSPSAPAARDVPTVLSISRRRNARRSISLCSVFAHWMIASARTKSDCGMVRPSALAVFRLMTSSNRLQRLHSRRHFDGSHKVGRFAVSPGLAILPDDSQKRRFGSRIFSTIICIDAPRPRIDAKEVCRPVSACCAHWTDKLAMPDDSHIVMPAQKRAYRNLLLQFPNGPGGGIKFSVPCRMLRRRLCVLPSHVTDEDHLDQ